MRRSESAARVNPVILPEPETGRTPLGKGGRVLMLMLLYLPCLLVRVELDNDIWFLLNSGRYVLQHGIPFIEPFTLHPNMTFLMQQWLSAVVFQVVYSGLGAYGIIALMALTFAGIITVLYRLTYKISRGNQLASFLTTFFTAAVLTPFLTTRPMNFTLLILLGELYLLESYIEQQKIGWLIPLPFLSALFINMHTAMWPMQFVILLPYFIDSFKFKFLCVEGQGYRKAPLFLAALAMFAAGFLNPYGIRAVTYLTRSYGYQEIGVVYEMQAADVNNMVGKFIFGTFLVVIAVYLLYRAGKTRLRYVLLAGGTALLALSSVRSFVLFLICGIFSLAYYLQDIRLQKKKERPEKDPRRLRRLLAVLVVFAFAFLCFSRYFSIVKAEKTPEVAAPVNYLLQNEETDGMVLYTGYNDGNYAEYMGLRPYIDARAEVFVKKNNGVADIMKEYYDLQMGILYYKDVLDQYGFTHLLVATGDILYTYLPYDDAYKLIYEDETYAIYKAVSAP